MHDGSETYEAFSGTRTIVGLTRATTTEARLLDKKARVPNFPAPPRRSQIEGGRRRSL